METLQVTRAHAAQGGVTLGPEQGEPGANFCHVGIRFAGPDMMSEYHGRKLLTPLYAAT